MREKLRHKRRGRDKRGRKGEKKRERRRERGMDGWREREKERIGEVMGMEESYPTEV